MDVTNREKLVIAANQKSRASQNYKGFMDELKIFDRALSSAEVKELHQLEDEK
jgi:hypothetical protein